MITCVIQYTLDPHAIEDFEKYATTWPPIIARCGGELTGYYLPKEGANDWAVALIDFESLAAYEQYRARLAADPEAQANVAFVRETRAILAERRSFLRKVLCPRGFRGSSPGLAELSAGVPGVVPRASRARKV
jgi:NIPSNAP